MKEFRVNDVEKNDTPHINQLFSLGLNSEVVGKLNTLKSKGFDVNKILTELLEKRDNEISEKKENTAKEVTKDEERRLKEGKEATRYIPEKVTIPISSLRSAKSITT